MSLGRYIEKRIEIIEAELADIKRLIGSSEKSAISLRGVWAGSETSVEEVEEAKRSLFKGSEIDNSD